MYPRFRKRKQPAHRGQILFIDASKLFKKGRNQNTLTSEHIDQIFTCTENTQMLQGQPG